MNEQKGLVVLGLRAENVKGLKVVTISPDPTFQVVSGKNGAGKSTLIDSIWLALKGRIVLDKMDQPIRNGENEAYVEVDLGEIRAIRRITKSGTTIEVRSKEGGKLSSPQKILDQLVGELSFDPLAFAAMKPSEQRKTLLDLVGVDTEPFDNEKSQYFEKRTEVGREVKNFQGQINGLLDYRCQGEPETELTTSSLIQEYEEANKKVTENQKIKDNYAKLIEEYREYESNIASLEEEIKQMEVRLQKLKEDRDQCFQRGQAEREVVLNLVDPDLSEIKNRMDHIDVENIKIRKRNEYRAVDQKLTATQKQYDDLTSKIQEVEGRKLAALADAKFPIDGLGISDEGITFQDGPDKPVVQFKDISDGMKMKVSVAIAMALNPDLRVIRISNASLLDKENTEIIRELAKDKGYQVWAEVVDETGKAGVFIEDGEVKAVN